MEFWRGTPLAARVVLVLGARRGDQATLRVVSIQMLAGRRILFILREKRERSSIMSKLSG